MTTKGASTYGFVLTLLLIFSAPGCVSSRLPEGRSTDRTYAISKPHVETAIGASDYVAYKELGRTYRVEDIGKSGMPRLSMSQMREVEDVRNRVKPQYRKYLRFAFYWGGLAVFLSRTP